MFENVLCLRYVIDTVFENLFRMWLLYVVDIVFEIVFEIEFEIVFRLCSRLCFRLYFRLFLKFVFWLVC